MVHLERLRGAQRGSIHTVISENKEQKVRDPGAGGRTFVNKEQRFFHGIKAMRPTERLLQFGIRKHPIGTFCLCSGTFSGKNAPLKVSTRLLALLNQISPRCQHLFWAERIITAS